MALISSGEPSLEPRLGRPELFDLARTFTVRRARENDLPRWRELYAEYAEHYQVPVDSRHQDLVWSWGMDPAHSTEIWLAVDEVGVAQGLAHIRPFTRPLAGSLGGFLDDLVVARSARRSGAVDALLAALAEIAVKKSWTVLRWITADDNHRARRVYDAYALRTMWLIFDMQPSDKATYRPGFESLAESFVVRPLESSDYERWRHLYAQFSEHYKVPIDSTHQDMLWSWLRDPDDPLEGFVAVDREGVAQGLAHIRAFARPLLGSVGCFLDDLLVDKAARRSGVADALLVAMQNLASEKEWSVVRWITADDNYRAKQVYDFYGTRTMWVTYDMAPRQLPDDLKGVLQWQ